MALILNELREALRAIAHHPDYNRIYAEFRYLLIKEASRFQGKERKRLGKAYRARRALKDFCQKNGISVSSLYRFRKQYKMGGIDALLPVYGKDATKPKQPKKPKPQQIRSVKIDMDLREPLSCLNQIHEVIGKETAIDAQVKKSSLLFLEQCHRYSSAHAWTYKRVDLGRNLTLNEIEKLSRFVKGTHIHKRERATALLMANDGGSLLNISATFRKSVKTVHNWFKLYEIKGIDFVETALDRKKNNPELRNRKDRIVKIIHQSPQIFNINRATWHIDGIAEAYKQKYGIKLSTTTICRAIKETNYTWRRAKKVLTSPDPNYAEKVKKILSALHNLKSDEAFFFVDEAGPWPVKKYGGKSLTQSGTIKIFPQYQKIKGRVTLIGALDAINNQVYWFFIKAKNSMAVIALIKILYFRFADYSKLYLTWDKASWHGSKAVKQCIEWINAFPQGPAIKVLPLPSQSQFLNVIESVFGGVKNAVIFNSDYQSESDMKKAIQTHLADRNRYFKSNPKRVGNKIWDREFFDVKEVDAGIFKRV